MGSAFKCNNEGNIKHHTSNQESHLCRIIHTRIEGELNNLVRGKSYAGIPQKYSRQVLHSHPFPHLRFHPRHSQIVVELWNASWEKELQGDHVQQIQWLLARQDTLALKAQQPTD